MQYNFLKDGISYTILIKNDDYQKKISFIVINNNINNKYSLDLSLKDFFDKDEFFQRSNSLNEVFQLINISFQRNQVFLEQLDVSSIILGIQSEKSQNICFTLLQNYSNNYNILIQEKYYF